MTTQTNRSLRSALPLIAAAALTQLTLLPAIAGAQAPPTNARSSVGVAMPQSPGSRGSDLAEPLQNGLVATLQGSAFDVVPLASREPAQAEAEAAAKHCKYVLQLSLEQKNSSGIGSLLRKVAPLAGAALPALGSLRGGGGGGLANAASAMAQQAATASAQAAQQQALAQMAGVQQSSVKAGDTITLQYRLVAPGQTSPAKEDKLEAKAQADGEDVLTPLVQRVAGAVASAGGVQPAAATATPAAAPAGTPQRDGSMPSGGVDCAKIASMPLAIMSLEACQKMMAAQQSYSTAAADPSAARAGDERMSCDQITAELKQQTYAAPDKAKLAQGQQAAAAVQAINAKQQAEVTAIAAKQQVALNAALASDKAVEVSTAGVVRPSSAMALQQTFMEQNKVTGERMARERNPADQRLMGAAADQASDATGQLQSDPRLARLIQLAQAKGCRGQ